MTDLAQFLLARIAEDEEAAKAAPDRERWTAQGLRYQHDFDAAVGEGDDPPFALVEDAGTALHIVRWDPARVLAECEAKRRIVVRCQEMQTAAVPMAAHLATRTLADLALPYADHPDYPSVSTTS